MATEDRVVIKVEIDVDSLGDLAKVTAAMKAIEAQEKRLNRQTNVMGQSIDKVDKAGSKLSKTVASIGNAFASLFRITTKFNFIGMAAEIGLVSLALGGVKLALVAGRFAAKAYQIALQGLGVAAAGAAGAIGTVVAAMSEFQQVSLFPLLGSMRSAASAVRGVFGDSLLSFFGPEGLTGSINALAQSSNLAAASFPGILRGLGNFARDGKQLQALAEVFAQISSEGKVTSDTLGGLTAVNPVFASALAELSTGKVLSGDAAMKIASDSAELGQISAEEFSRVFTGELESTNLWEGQLERMNGTLQGMVMGLVTRIGAMFVDLGKPFLDPFKEAINEIELITSNTIIRLRSVITQFGIESFIPGLVGTFEKLADFVVRMANEGMPKLIGIMERVGGFFDSMENFFRNIGAILAPLERGAEIMMGVFGPFLRNIFGAKGFGGLIMDAAQGFEDNAESMEKMAQALGDFAFSFMGIFRDLQDAFFSGSDEIAEFFTVLSSDVMPVVREMLDVFRTIFREALPTINTLLREMSQILLPILQLLNQLISSTGGLGAAALFGLGAARKGGLPGPAMAGVGMGGALGGLPGAILGGLGMHAAGKGLAGKGGLGGLLMGGGRHAAPTSLTKFLGGPTMALGAGIGLGAHAGAGSLNRHFGASGGIASNSWAMAGGGALAGAGTGALIGSVVPVIGTAVGAIVGGIVGAIGAGLGTAGVNASRDKAQLWIEEQVDAVSGEIQRGLDKGLNRTGIKDGRAAIRELLDPGNIASLAEQFKLTEDEMRSTMQDMTEGMLEEINRRDLQLQESLNFISDQFKMTEDEILHLADVMAVDLSDGFNTLIEDLTKLGVLIGPEGIVAAVQAIGEESTLAGLFGPGSVLGRGVAASQAATMKEELNAILDVFAAAPTAENLQEILTLGQGIAQLEFGERGTELLFRAEDLLKQIMDPTDDAYVGAPQAALAGQVLSQDVQPLIRQLEDGTHPIYDPIKGQLAALEAVTKDPSFGWERFFNEEIVPQVEAGGGFGEASIERVIEGFSLETAAFALEITGAGTEFSSDVMSSATFLSSSVRAAGAAFMGQIASAQIRVNSYTQARESGNSGSSDGKSPYWGWKGNYPGGDTATSRMGRVLGFHSALSSRLGGKFRVTSGLRGWGIGSGSDHLSGGAIDLVGNNLGQYSNAINNMGGFAEFHGRGGSRHLHAVPPVGDTATPSLSGGRGGGGSVTISPTFMINGAGDPEAVAEAVMARLDKMMRDEEERR